MPNMDGFEFLEEFHQNPAWQKIPVIVLTAMDLTADDRKRLNGSVEKILTKTAQPRDRFMEKVKRAVATITTPKINS